MPMTLPAAFEPAADRRRVSSYPECGVVYMGVLDDQGARVERARIR